MKKVYFILVFLIVVLATHAQKIIVADSAFSRLEVLSLEKQVNLKVYRTKEADQFIRRHENEMKPGEHWLGKNNIPWYFWIVDRIVPKEVQKALLYLPDIRKHGIDCYLMVYYNNKGQIVTGEYIIDDSIRAKISDDQLNLIYRNLVKEKVVNPYEISNEKKESIEEYNRNMNRSNEIFYTRISLVNASKAIIRGGENLMNNVKSRIESSLSREINTDNGK